MARAGRRLRARSTWRARGSRNRRRSRARRSRGRPCRAHARAGSARCVGRARRARSRAWLRDPRADADSQPAAALLHDSRVAAVDRVPVTRWPGAAVYRYRGHLYAALRARSATAADRAARGSHSMSVQDRRSSGGRRSARASRSRLAATVGSCAAQAAASPAKGQRAHRQSFRKWLQQRAIVPWQGRQFRSSSSRAASRRLPISPTCRSSPRSRARTGARVARTAVAHGVGFPERCRPGWRAST